MPRVTAPLLSFGATGQIAKSQVYASWKGIPYVRRYAVPADPKTEKQQANRAVWAMLNGAYLYAPSAVRAVFDAFAQGKPLTGRNKFFSENVVAYRGYPKPETLAGFVFSCGARGGLPPVTVDFANNAGSVEATLVLPDVPTGWTLVASHLAAIPDQPPVDEFRGEFRHAMEASAPNFVTIDMSDFTGPVIVGAWLEWTKPNGDTAYSASLPGVVNIA